MPEYLLHNVCPSSVQLDIENGLVKNIRFSGGCPGNLSALAKLLDGLPPEAIIEKLSGIHCGDRPTSCADQLAKVLANITTEG